MFKKIFVIAFWIFFIFHFTLIQAQAVVIVNPASKYCEDLGYKWQNKMTEEGEIGFCIMPDGTEVDEWAFIKGEEGEEWNYCSQQGYKAKRIDDSEKCQNIFSKDCVVCVLDDGKEVEATELMAEESPPEECKGPFCARLEAEASSSSGIAVGNQKVNQKKNFFSSHYLLAIIFGGLVFLALIIIAIIYYIKRKKESDDNNDIQYSQPKDQA